VADLRVSRTCSRAYPGQVEAPDRKDGATSLTWWNLVSSGERDPLQLIEFARILFNQAMPPDRNMLPPRKRGMV
jgi:hypothetical protein